MKQSKIKKEQNQAALELAVSWVPCLILAFVIMGFHVGVRIMSLGAASMM